MTFSNFELIIEKIEEFDSICIFGHVRPDGDAYGSAMGLKLAIDFLFPNKQTYAVVDDVPYIPSMLPLAKKPGELPDSVISKSLCITVDTPTIARLGDPRAVKGKFVIKFDHHPLVEHFGDLEFVDPDMASCSLLISEFLFSQYPVISPASATCLLLGLITDTGGFRYTSNPLSFSMAGRLISNGADLDSIYKSVYTTSLDDLRIKGQILSNIQSKGVLAYEIFTKRQISALHYTADSLAPRVNSIGFTKECPVWAFFCQYPDGTFRAEFRCTKEYDVSKAATEVGGGGHEQASGATLADQEAVEKAIQLFSSLKPIKK